jgi:hypothetical protein
MVSQYFEDLNQLVLHAVALVPAVAFPLEKP